MQQFILRRLLYSIITLWLLTMIVFAVVRFTGDPAFLMSDYPGVRTEDLTALRTQWGLDKPYITQYWKFISNVVQGELGQSFQFNMPVRDIYFRRLPNSLQLACAGFLISVLIGIPLGMMSAMRINTWWDSVGKLVALMGLSIPGFFVAMVLILPFGVYLQWLPILGKGQQFELRYFLMPAFALGWYFAGSMLRLTRSSMLEVLGSDYVKLARFKGTPEWVVIVKHAFRVVFVAVFADVLAPHDPEVSVKTASGRPVKSYLPPFWMQGGSLTTPLGTDFHSRDILSRLLYGARVSLLVGVLGTLVAGALGTTLGVLAGYLGGWHDQVIMRLTDAWMALPTLIFAIFLASVLKPSLWNIVVILSLVFWSQYTRIIRGQVLSLRERPFVQLAQVTGVRTWRIVWRHILPNVMNTVMVLFSLTVGVAIIIEASLSFLGVGVPPPKPAWGLMMSEGRGPLIAGKWWVSVFPGLCIMLLVLATNLLGDWLRVRLDPQLRNQ